MSHRDLKFVRQQVLSSAVGAAISLAVVGTSACSVGLHPHTTLEGVPFNRDRLATLREGMSEQEVLALVGAPLESQRTEDDSVFWRYYERTRLRGCTMEFLGFIPLGDTPVRSVEALVFFRSGTVERVQLSESEQF